MTTKSPSDGLTPNEDRLVTGALLHGKIAGLTRALEGLTLIEVSGGGLPELREWLERVVGVNETMRH